MGSKVGEVLYSIFEANSLFYCPYIVKIFKWETKQEERIQVGEIMAS